MPSGWYPDAQGRQIEHFWSGNHWTGQTRAAQGMPAQPFTAPTVPPAYPPGPPVPFLTPVSRRPWYQRTGVVITAAVIAALIVIGAVAGALSPPKKSNAANSISGPSAPTTQPAIPPVTTPAPNAIRRTDRHAHRDARRSSSYAAPAVPAGSFIVPNEIGKDLQSAQDDLQRVSGDPVFVSHSHDLLEDRYQILDRDWQVCTQNVDAGTRVSAVGHIDFGVVKTYESCP
jgi:hypothetical protein